MASNSTPEAASAIQNAHWLSTYLESKIATLETQLTAAQNARRLADEARRRAEDSLTNARCVSTYLDSKVAKLEKEAAMLETGLTAAENAGRLADEARKPTLITMFDEHAPWRRGSEALTIPHVETPPAAMSHDSLDARGYHEAYLEALRADAVLILYSCSVSPRPDPDSTTHAPSAKRAKFCVAPPSPNRNILRSARRERRVQRGVDVLAPPLFPT
ncbi:hypothetical protein C8R44DRAFT_824057 [Mycena epipterygia]|nr:hypothetical protein C8R44DRAFT_824057 [Mycena epipterygia]